MPHYLEERRTTLNARGVERGDPALSVWLTDREAEHHGFSGDGTGGNTHRLWRSIRDLGTLPDGIESITKTDFDDAIALRESTKPDHTPPVLPPTRDEVLEAALSDTSTVAGLRSALQDWVTAR